MNTTVAATKLCPNRKTTSEYLRFQSNLGFMEFYERPSSETYVLLKRGSAYKPKPTFHESFCFIIYPEYMNRYAFGNMNSNFHDMYRLHKSSRESFSDIV